MKLVPPPVWDSNTGHAAVFGYVYKVDPLSVMDQPDKVQVLIEMCDSAKIRNTYDRVKGYYKNLVEQRQTNAYR